MFGISGAGSSYYSPYTSYLATRRAQPNVDAQNIQNVAHTGTVVPVQRVSQVSRVSEVQKGIPMSDSAELNMKELINRWENDPVAAITRSRIHYAEGSETENTASVSFNSNYGKYGTFEIGLDVSEEEPEIVAFPGGDDKAQTVQFPGSTDDEAQTVEFPGSTDDEAQTVGFPGSTDDEAQTVGFPGSTDDEAQTVEFPGNGSDEAQASELSNGSENEKQELSVSADAEGKTEFNVLPNTSDDKAENEVKSVTENGSDEKKIGGTDSGGEVENEKECKACADRKAGGGSGGTLTTAVCPECGTVYSTGSTTGKDGVEAANEMVNRIEPEKRAEELKQKVLLHNPILGM